MKRFSKHTLCTLILLSYFACETSPPAHSHGSGSHSHDNESGITVTQWSDKTELFMEYPQLAADNPGTFVIHLSDLSDFSAVSEGHLVCIFSRKGGTTTRFELAAPDRAGIYLPDITLEDPGIYDLTLQLNGAQVNDTIFVKGIRVYKSTSEFPQLTAEEGADEISFLKEQQWKIDFRTEPVQVRQLNASISAPGELQPRPQWHAVVPAPSSGIILAEKNQQLLPAGRWVKRGTPLAIISPTAGTDNGFNDIHKDYLLAKAEFERAQRLYQQEAIPQKRVEEAQLLYRAKKASYEVIASQSNLTNSGDPGQKPLSHFELRAPIDGFIEVINFRIGDRIEAGTPLFTITNPRRLLLQANVPAAHIGQLRDASDASFQLEGDDQRYQISQLDGKLLSIGSTIHKASRTVPVLFEFRNPDNALKIGMFARVELSVGPATSGIAIPDASIFDDDGLPVAYVHVAGETFEKRILKTGIAEGGYTLITQGISAGERVVTLGGYQVKMASRATSIPAGHGHPH